MIKLRKLNAKTRLVVLRVTLIRGLCGPFGYNTKRRVPLYISRIDVPESIELVANRLRAVVSDPQGFWESLFSGGDRNLPHLPFCRFGW
jgi:hypothetical protein